MKQPQGLTNKIIFKDNLITKVSRPEVDYYLNRPNEAKLYDYFLTLGEDVDFILRPVGWGYDQDNNFFSQFTYIDKTYTFLEQPDYTEANLQLIKELIDKYHELKPKGMVQFLPQEYLDKFRKAIKQPFFNLDEYEAQLKEIINHYYDDNKVCFSHNDLTAGNFLYVSPEDVKLIDYEYSMNNHYLFDYGSFITESLNGNHELEFIDLLNLAPTEMDKLYDIMFYQLILWINWCNYMFEINPLPIYKELAEQKYQALQQWPKKNEA